MGATLGGAMIHDVDESLRALVRRDALNGAQVEIAFDAPTRDWVARRNAPTVDLYLYDIREDLQRREVAWEGVRNEAGIVTERRPPARRFRLSYLVTAWTQRPEDEHRLLSAVLGCLIRNPTLPGDLLGGELAKAKVPILLTVALPPPQDRSLADVWSALGGELKPSLDLVVTAPLDANVYVEAAPPVSEQPSIRITQAEGDSEETSLMRAAERRSGPGRALGSGESPMQEESLQPGRRIARGRPPGAAEAGSSRRRRSTAPEPESEADAEAVDSTPGRRIIVRGFPRP